MNVMRKLVLVVVIGLFSFTANAANNLLVVASSNKDFSTLVSLLKQARLDEALEGNGPFTVFAPTNKAFAAVPKSQLDTLVANPDQLKAVLLYHVVSGDQIQPGKVKTLSGQDLDITSKNGKTYVNSTPINTPDVKASNGVIRVINQVLMPSASSPSNS